jgi:uncharacterized protein YndB with AHSA1/START domain
MAMPQPPNTEVPDVRRSIVVPGSPESAFDVYTSCPAEWLPAAHRFLPGAHVVAFEPRIGGRFYERDADGTEATRGTITDWAPPARLAVTWRIGPGWRPVLDDEHASVIVVEFSPAGPDATEVTLTYTHLDRHGEMADTIRSAVEHSSPDDTLHRYAEAVARHLGPGSRP